MGPKKEAKPKVRKKGEAHPSCPCLWCGKEVNKENPGKDCMTCRYVVIIYCF